MKPKFKLGKNMALKIPSNQFKQTVSFYKTVLGLEQIDFRPDVLMKVSFLSLVIKICGSIKLFH